MTEIRVKPQRGVPPWAWAFIAVVLIVGAFLLYRFVLAPTQGSGPAASPTPPASAPASTPPPGLLLHAPAL